VSDEEEKKKSRRYPGIGLPRIEIEPAPRDTDFARKVIDHINEKSVAPNDECPVCGSPDNTVMSEPYQLSIRAKEGAIASGRFMPVITTVCRNCGFVRMFNEIVLRHLIEGGDGDAS
jgi:hypothetical protein